MSKKKTATVDELPMVDIKTRRLITGDDAVIRAKSRGDKTIRVQLISGTPKELKELRAAHLASRERS